MFSVAEQLTASHEKSKTHDRQIRLWGDHGQTLLGNAYVCLINATVLGAEILKGVILPGIKGFTIVDNKLATEEDIGCNFFLDWRSIGQSRAKSCVRLLQELSPDVHGKYVVESVDQIISAQPEFFKKFDVVVATALDELTIVGLSNLLWELNIPLIVCRSVGFYGVARLQIREHCIVESHPDNRQSDLRLMNPFEELKRHMADTELTSKVPWLVVLYKCLQEWVDAHEGRYPTLDQQKDELRAFIRSKMVDDQNFGEAIRAVNSSLVGGKPNLSIMKILTDNRSVNVNNENTAFWILTRALRDFVENEGNGFLPLPGVIPDMTADSISYVNLQNVYRSKAALDAEIVYHKAQQLLRELNKPKELIIEKDVRLFCREAANIAVVRGSKIADEYSEGFEASKIQSGLETPNSLMAHYITLRAMDKFQAKWRYFPGEGQVEEDISQINRLVAKMLSDWGISTPISDAYTHEVCRYGGAEIHSISAFMGGCIAQELIKLIIKQYKPFDNVFVYDGYTLQSVVYKL